MDKEKMCPILTVGQAIMLAHRRDAAFESCWWPCAGENCVMYESCVPQVLTVVSQIGERPEGGWCDDSRNRAIGTIARLRLTICRPNFYSPLR